MRSQPEGHFEQHAATVLAAHNFFSPEHPVLVARAPGRLDVMGGNVDYTGGFVLQGLLREATWAAGQPRTDGMVRVFNPDATRFDWNSHFDLQLRTLRSADSVQKICNTQEGTFWGRYVLGAIHYLLRREADMELPAGGVDLFISSDLPPNRGVSSSAALTIAALKAVAAAWKIPLAGTELATAGQWVENVIAGAACGIMDQAAIVLGRRDHLVPLLCQPCIPSAAIGLPPGLCIWGIDSMAPRSTTGASYETARAAAFMGYRMICDQEGIDIMPDARSNIPRFTDIRWHGYLSNLTPSEFRSRYEYRLPEFLPGNEFLERCGEHVDPFTSVAPSREYPVRAAVRYAVEESFRVQMVGALLKAMQHGKAKSDLRLIGDIFHQSHHAYAECGLGSKACDELVNRMRRAGLVGAKMTGGGAGGVVAVLGRAEDRNVFIEVAEGYASTRDSAPHIFEGSSDGVDTIGTRVLQLSNTWMKA